MKEEPQEIEKLWGHEVVLFPSRQKYCAKLLHLLKGAQSSRHRHPRKEESFACLEGTAVLMVGGKSFMLTPFTRPKTIEAGEVHSFHGVTEAVILEVSTRDDPEEVERFSTSQAGVTY